MAEPREGWHGTQLSGRADPSARQFFAFFLRLQMARSCSRAFGVFLETPLSESFFIHLLPTCTNEHKTLVSLGAGSVRRGSTHVALKLCSLSMYCITYRSFRRSRTYSRSISGYKAAHSGSLCVSTSFGFGAMNATGQLGREANMGISIRLCIRTIVV
jgi:hypothetical protein